MVKQLGIIVKTKISDFIYMIGYLGKLISASIMFAKRGKAARKILIMQLLFTYVEALPICSILAIGIGTSVVLLGNSFLTSLGQAKLTYDMLVLIVMRELGPLLIAFVVTARSATAIATEISSMVVGHEIEAYIASGVDPISHLAAPRFIAVTLSLFFLNIYFSIFGLMAPSIVIQFISTTNIIEYFNNLFSSLSVKVIIISIIKSIIFGMIISGSATLYGFNAGQASTEIPMAGLRAVSKAFSLCIIADVFITVLSYVL
ncbi:MAG: ABC transporter permease [Treponema sp.]|nr:ABC transporter permease [Treponema sp.]